MLTETQIRRVEPWSRARKLSDGGGLCLLNGKPKTLPLGVYPDVPPEKARARHQAARRLLAAGTDPSLRRQALRTHAVAKLGIVENTRHLPKA